MIPDRDLDSNSINHKSVMPVGAIVPSRHAARNVCPNHSPMRAEPVTVRDRISTAPNPRTMNTDPSDDPHSAAVEQLEQFGLSAYAARTFVALKSLGTGTAKDVSGVSDVPRTRVYDAIDELHERGLVDVQQSSPKEFWAISAGTAGQKFEQEMDYRLSILSTALAELEPASRSEEQKGVWTVDGQPAVTDRVIEFVQGADDEIVYMTVEDLLTDDVIDALGTAAERGVTISLGGVSSNVQDRIKAEIPGAELFDSL